jgi:hypothetical protein
MSSPPEPRPAPPSSDPDPHSAPAATAATARIARIARLDPSLRTGGRLAEDQAEQARAPRLATGLAAVDRLLGGGFPRGRLSEITGPLSSGRTSLAVALAAVATRAGEVAAWIDRADALDPASLEAAGVVTERLLWVRPTRSDDALRCAERLLVARGFALVVLDLDPLDARAGAWLRLTRCASASATALVLLGREPALGSFAALAVDLRATRLRFAERPAWLEGLEARLALRRAAGAPPSGSSGSLDPARSVRPSGPRRAGCAEGFAPVCWKVPPLARDHPEPDEGAL